MIEKIKNLFKKEHDPLSSDEKLQLIENSSKLVDPGVFYSTLIVIASFLPVFYLQVWKESYLAHWLGQNHSF
jgi:Cu(I)/Ag(I) efflux system membrane protein CusA/SilA